MAKNTVVLEDQHGVVVQRVSEERARGLVWHGVAHWVGRRLRLADPRDEGPGMDRRTPAGITHRQMFAAAGAVFAAPSSAELYQARRIAAWPHVHDMRAVLVGR